MENYKELKEAAAALARVCDNAVEKDGQGYNSYDSNFAKQLLAKSFWTYNMATAIHKMLNKYSGQLLNFGIRYEELPLPDPTEAIYIPTARTEFKRAEIKIDTIYLNFSTPTTEEFNKILEEIRKLPGRVWNKDNKQWELPANKFSYDKLKELGFEIKGQAINEIDTKDIVIPVDKGLRLYPFQEDGIKLLEKFNGRALLADDMGLGKTIQVITYLKLHPELRPAIIICPATLKINWQRELKKWLPKATTRVVQGRQFVFDDDYDITIINYDILKDYLELLMEIDFRIMILDESHAIKSSKAQRSKAVKKLSRRMEKIICMTGTPITNRPIEFFTTLNMLDSKLFPNYYHFGMEFCSGEQGAYGLEFKGASNIEKLNAILRNSFMIRRKKEDVLKELPPKQRTVIPLEIDNRKEYDAAEADIINYLSRTEGEETAQKAVMAEALIRFNKLKQLTIAGKMKQIISWIDNFLESDEKLIIFCIHHKTTDTLMEKYSEIAVKLDGRDSPNQKQKAVDAFQSDARIKLFIGNIQAAGVGITLTAACNVAFLELPWVPAFCDQAEDRSLRIGQKANCVNIYYLLGLNTVEEEISEIIDSKRRVITAIMDGELPEQQSMLTILMNRYRRSK